MRKTIAAAVATTAALGGLAVAAPAEAATRTLTSGVYATPAGRDMGVAPKYMPIASPGTYKTTGRPVNKACALRALDAYGQEAAGVLLVNARSFTIRVPAHALIIEVSGVCKWRRA